MNISRKQFCETMAAAGILAILPACGGGGGGGGYTPASPGGGLGGSTSTACGAEGAAIVPEHGHALAVPDADLASMVDVAYDIRGSADHTHQVTLTVADLAALKAGKTVTVTSTETLNHAHQVSVSCTG